MFSRTSKDRPSSWGINNVGIYRYTGTVYTDTWGMISLWRIRKHTLWLEVERLVTVFDLFCSECHTTDTHPDHMVNIIFQAVSKTDGGTSSWRKRPSIRSTHTSHTRVFFFLLWALNIFLFKPYNWVMLKSLYHTDSRKRSDTDKPGFLRSMCPPDVIFCAAAFCADLILKALLVARLKSIL